MLPLLFDRFLRIGIVVVTLHVARGGMDLRPPRVIRTFSQTLNLGSIQWAIQRHRKAYLPNTRLNQSVY